MIFSKFLNTINSNFRKIIEDSISVNDVNLELDLSSIRGKDFYDILTLVTNDFDKDCDKALSDIAEGAKKRYLAKHKKTKTVKSKNRYQGFIEQFTTLQSDVAEKAFIENTRFTKVLNLRAKDFYAYEVYLISTSQGISTKSAFEKLYK